MSIFSNSCETKELHKNEELRTRYYKNNFKQVEDAIRKICDEEDMQLQESNKRYGDIYVCAFNYEIFFSVIEVNPIETAVDMKVNFFTTMGFNRPVKKAIHIYDRLNQLLTYKGKMLHI